MRSLLDAAGIPEQILLRGAQPSGPPVLGGNGVQGRGLETGRWEPESWERRASEAARPALSAGASPRRRDRGRPRDRATPGPSGGTWVMESPKSNTRGQYRELAASHSAILPAGRRAGRGRISGWGERAGGGASGVWAGFLAGERWWLWWWKEAAGQFVALRLFVGVAARHNPGSWGRAPLATNQSLLRRAVAVALGTLIFVRFLELGLVPSLPVRSFIPSLSGAERASPPALGVPTDPPGEAPPRALPGAEGATPRLQVFPQMAGV